jgi:hypothetical protein
MEDNQNTVLVCGGRLYNDKAFLFSCLDAYCAAVGGFSRVVHGGAKGADFLAGEWAKTRGIPERVYKADWNRYGRRAGFVRNSKMLEAEHPDIVIAFPGGSGTKMMVRIAKDKGIAVYEV